MGRTLQRCPQTSLLHLRRHHRPSASSGDQCRPRPLALPLRDHLTVQHLSSGKAPGSDVISAKIYKHGGLQLVKHLTAIFQVTWRQGEFSKDFKDATVVYLYKRKCNRRLCDDHRHRGIRQINIAGKVFVRILPNRLKHYLEQGLLPDRPCGFHRHRLTIGMIFAARQLQEKCQNMRVYLYSNLVGLTRTFNTVISVEL
ncbi:hypothetical protein SprV_0902678200 [Sparganum proliferum]